MVALRNARPIVRGEGRKGGEVCRVLSKRTKLTFPPATVDSSLHISMTMSESRSGCMSCGGGGRGEEGVETGSDGNRGVGRYKK
jgi:hypothetical protein